MHIFLIYKSFLDSYGNAYKIELVECDTSEQMAQRFSKLYNLQIPLDMRDKINYGYLGSRAI